MNKLSRISKIGAIVLFVGAFASSDVVAGKGDRAWNACTKKVPQLAKIVLEGIVAAYSVYLITGQISEALPTCERVLKGRFNPWRPLVNELLKRGCLITGLGMLMFKAGNWFLNDIEAL